MATGGNGPDAASESSTGGAAGSGTGGSSTGGTGTGGSSTGGTGGSGTGGTAGVDAGEDASVDAQADGPWDASMDVEPDVIPEAAPDAIPDGPPPPCNGALVGGFCWYWGGEEASCDQTCSAHGGYHVATKDYAGSAGTNAHCEAVLDALGVPGSGSLTTLGGSGAGVGCFYMNFVDARHRVGDVATSPAAIFTLARRACACQQ